MHVGIILLIVMIALLLGGFGKGINGVRFYGTGHYGLIAMSLVAAALMVLLLLGRL